MSYEIESPINESTLNNNSLATADQLLAGTAMVGSLGSSSDLDYFLVSVDSAGLIQLHFYTSLLSNSSYFKVRILDSAGDLLHTTASSVAGTPLVNGAHSGGKDLTIDGVENVPPAGTLFHFLTTGADTTTYTVVSATSLSGGSTTLTLDKTLPESVADNTPLVFDSARLLTGSSGTLTAVAPAAGNYYVQVLAGDFYSNAAYELTVDIQPTVENEGVYGNGSVTASAAENLALAADANNRLLENVEMTGALSSAADVDCWVFTTAVSSDFAVTFGSDSTNTTDEWKIEITDASGAVLSGGSLTAGDLASLSVNAASFPTGETFMVKVSATSSSVYNTSNYTLKVSGANLDLNDAPVLTVGGVSGSTPFLPIDSGVTRAVAQGDAGGIALTEWFNASDADTSQTIAYYRLSLTKADGVVSDAVVEVGSGASLKTYGFAAGAQASGSVVLTAQEMATAIFKPGTTVSGTELTLNLQAYDSTSTRDSLGGVDGSGASAIIEQSVLVVSANAGITANSDQTKLTLSENTRGEGSDKPHSTTFTLVLKEQPSADVKVYLVDVDNQLDFAVGGVSGELLTFTSANWDTPQTVTVKATADSTAETSQTGTLSFTVVSTDATYDGFSVSPIVFTIVDNAAPVLTAPTTINYTDTSAADSFTNQTGTLSATDANGDAITYGIAGGTVSAGLATYSNTFGSLSVNTTSGAYTFTPSASGINGAAAQDAKTFTVTASDGGLTSSKILTISVAGVNDKPTATATTPAQLTESSGLNNGTSGTLISSSNLTLSDAEGQTPSIDTAKLEEALWTASSDGSTYTKVGTFGAASLAIGTATLSYALSDSDSDTQALKAGATGQDVFSIAIKDSAGLTNTVSVTFRVNGANDLPTISAIADKNAAIGSEFSLALGSLVFDPEGDAITLAVTLESGDDLPSWLSFDANSKTLSGTPTLADEGTLSLLLSAADSIGAVEAYFNVFVLNSALEALLVADVKSTLEDAVLVGNVLTNDSPAAGIPLEVATYSVSGAQYSAGQSATISGVGVFKLDTDGAYVFTPAANYAGTVPQISYVANLDQGVSTLDIAVTAVDDPSFLQADRAQLTAGTTVTGNVLNNDSDIDSSLSVSGYLIAGDQTSYTAGEVGVIEGKGTFTLAANGAYTFVPASGFLGTVPLVTYTTNTGLSSTLSISAGVDVTVQTYHWKSHALLPSATVALDSQVGNPTNDQGSVLFSAVAQESVSLAVSRDVPSAEVSATNASVNLIDAIAILKMIVGLDVNGAGQPLSPYQALAADFDGNGVVQLTDAIGVLKHVVGLDSPEPQWRFVDELQTGLKTSLDVGTVPAIARTLDLAAGAQGVGVVGFVAGDVDGSFAGSAGANTLANQYFIDLVADHSALSLTQFGIYS